MAPASPRSPCPLILSAEPIGRQKKIGVSRRRNPGGALSISIAMEQPVCLSTAAANRFEALRHGPTAVTLQGLSRHRLPCSLFVSDSEIALMETMLALVKKEAKPGLWLEKVPVPRIGINDVLIKILRTGICGTDVHIYEWDAWAQKTIPVPMVVGHEFVGQIVDVGSNVNDFHVGEIVSGEGHVVCGRCRNCLAGRRHLCKDTRGRRASIVRARLPSTCRCR